MGEHIKLDLDKIAGALRESITDEIKSATSEAYGLGRFLFSVSVGTLGLYATLLTLSSTPNTLDQPAVVFLLISFFPSLILAVPKPVIITSETNLQKYYQHKVGFYMIMTIIWTGAWVLGIISIAAQLF